MLNNILELVMCLLGLIFIGYLVFTIVQMMPIAIIGFGVLLMYIAFKSSNK